MQKRNKREVKARAKTDLLEMVHGDRLVNMDLDDGNTCLFERAAMKKETTQAYWEVEEEELRSQVAGTVLEARTDEQLEESMRERRQRQKPNILMRHFDETFDETIGLDI